MDDGTRTRVDRNPTRLAIETDPTQTDRDHNNKLSIPVVVNVNRSEIDIQRGIGVDDGTRTHDDRDHNPGLYQLSYAHH